MAGLAAAGSLLAVVGVAARATDADGVYRKAQKVYDAGRLPEALELFREAQRVAPLSNTAIHSNYFEGIILFRGNDWAEAERVFQRLVDRFPEAVAAPEALYHVGLCRKNRGQLEGAIQAWEETRRRFPDLPWAKYAGERIAEVRQ